MTEHPYPAVELYYYFMLSAFSNALLCYLFSVEWRHRPLRRHRLPCCAVDPRETPPFASVHSSRCHTHSHHRPSLSFVMMFDDLSLGLTGHSRAYHSGSRADALQRGFTPHLRSRPFLSSVVTCILDEFKCS